MNPRLSLLLLIGLLIGGALYVGLKPVQPVAPQVAPPPIAAPATPPADQPEVKPAAPPSDAAAETPPRQFLILAASWEPAFCETAPGKPECRSLEAKRFDASHFALHGLWPSDEYCDVSQAHEDNDRSGRWSELPPVELDSRTWAALETAMPGTRSQLERHEWTKHGTCFGTGAETYWRTAMRLLDTLNGSAVRDLFAQSAGREVTADAVRAAFDTAFGKGTGARVRLACEDDGNRSIITELTIGLYGVAASGADLASLMRAANPTKPGCVRGIVDPVGAQ